MSAVALSELNAFIAIADHKSFRAAAKLLEVSPSALSHAISGFEARMGVRLFNRTTRSVALTEAGERLLKRVRGAMADLEEAVADVAAMRDRPSGTIKISASEAGATPLVRHILPSFLAAYPDIQVEIIVDGRLVDIVADGFDAGVRLLESVPRDMIAIPIGAEMRFVAVASPAYIKTHAPPHAPHDLIHHHCIRFRFESGSIYRWDLERRGRTATIDVPGQFTVGNMNLAAEAAVAGIGIAWVPEDIIMAPLKSGKLVRVLEEWSPPFPGYCLYYPANRHPPAALRLFSQAVRSWVQGQRHDRTTQPTPAANKKAR